MGWTFKLERHTSSGYIGQYDEGALGQMSAYLMRSPNALQRSDGSIVLVESSARRDELVAQGRADEWQYGAAHLVLGTDGVRVEVEPHADELEELAKFFNCCMAHWPSTLCGEEGLGVVTVEQFLDAMDSTRKRAARARRQFRFRLPPARSKCGCPDRRISAGGLVKSWVALLRRDI